jgi:hypothetical protein
MTAQLRRKESANEHHYREQSSLSIFHISRRARDFDHLDRFPVSREQRVRSASKASDKAKRTARQDHRATERNEQSVAMDHRQLALAPMKSAKILILAVCLALVALADDFKTTDGKEYKNVTVKRVEPDGIVVSSKSGISKVYFTELPKEVQQRYGYDPGKASAYTAEQSAALEQARKQREEASRQKAEPTAREYQYLAEQQSAREFAKSQQDRVQALQASYQKLQQEEDALLSQIGEAERRHWNDSYRAQLPLLEGHLRDVRHNKAQVRQQLEQLQR